MRRHGRTDVARVYSPRQTWQDHVRTRYVVEEGTGCWVWQGPVNSAGYGRVQGRQTHRLSYELHHGPIPAGMHICHNCDNPPCLNPAHLWVGTPKENNVDMIAKGRAGWQKGC